MKLAKVAILVTVLQQCENTQPRGGDGYRKKTLMWFWSNCICPPKERKLDYWQISALREPIVMLITFHDSVIHDFVQTTEE